MFNIPSSGVSKPADSAHGECNNLSTTGSLVNRIRKDFGRILWCSINLCDIVRVPHSSCLPIGANSESETYASTNKTTSIIQRVPMDASTPATFVSGIGSS